MANFIRPRPIAWFFFLLAFGTTVALGSWQVQRLQWKERLIAEIAAANERAPVTTLPTEPTELAALQFRRVTLHGRWIPDQEFHLTPRYWHDQFGYAIVSPLKLADGRILLVNRGWVPGKKKLLETRPQTRVTGKTIIHGMVRTDTDRNYFTPPSKPEKNIWFGRDIPEMAAFGALHDVIPAMVDITVPGTPMMPEKVTDTLSDPSLPVPSDGKIRLRNNHLSYILTWYGIALGILVIFILYHRKKG